MIQRRLRRLSNGLKMTGDCASTREVGQNPGEENSKSIIKLRLLYVHGCPYIPIYGDTRHLPVQYAIERMSEKKIGRKIKRREKECDYTRRMKEWLQPVNHKES